MYYNRALREAGFDPANVENATPEDEFTLHIGLKELRGSRIGHPMLCSGARACKRQRGATFAWIGACVAILGFANGRVVRYQHNGQLPKRQDEGMFAVGEYKFHHISPSQEPSRRKERRASVSTSPKRSRGLREGISFRPEPSMAAQMRRGWGVRAK